MESRDNIQYENIGDLGKKKYLSDRFKIPDSDTWYSYNLSPGWSNMSKHLDGPLIQEIEYISALISDLSARRLPVMFIHEFNKWKRITKEIVEFNKEIKRPIKAIRRRIYRFENTSNDVILEIEMSLLRLLRYRNGNSESEFLIENHLSESNKI